MIVYYIRAYIFWIWIADVYQSIFSNLTFLLFDSNEKMNKGMNKFIQVFGTRFCDFV